MKNTIADIIAWILIIIAVAGIVCGLILAISKFWELYVVI